MKREVSDIFQRRENLHILDVARRSLKYIVLLETACQLASPIVQASQELVWLMNCAIEEEEVCQRGLSRFIIMEEKLNFQVKNGFRITIIANFLQCI